MEWMEYLEWNDNLVKSKTAKSMSDLYIEVRTLGSSLRMVADINERGGA